MPRRLLCQAPLLPIPRLAIVGPPPCARRAPAAAPGTLSSRRRPSPSTPVLQAAVSPSTPVLQATAQHQEHGDLEATRDPAIERTRPGHWIFSNSLASSSVVCLYTSYGYMTSTRLD
ncbi:hypothetical protein VPH35_083572 [Triticum aestivum]